MLWLITLSLKIYFLIVNFNNYFIYLYIFSRDFTESPSFSSFVYSWDFNASFLFSILIVLNLLISSQGSVDFVWRLLSQNGWNPKTETSPTLPLLFGLRRSQLLRRCPKLSTILTLSIRFHYECPCVLSFCLREKNMRSERQIKFTGTSTS